MRQHRQIQIPSLLHIGIPARFVAVELQSERNGEGGVQQFERLHQGQDPSGLAAAAALAQQEGRTPEQPHHRYQTHRLVAVSSLRVN